MFGAVDHALCGSTAAMGTPILTLFVWPKNQKSVFGTDFGDTPFGVG